LKMIAILLGFAFFQLALCDLDLNTGLYVPPVSEDDVFYPVDKPIGFSKISTPNTQEWRWNLDSRMIPFATQSFKKKYVTRGGRITNSNSGNSIEVAATRLCSEEGHRKGAEIVARLLANISDDVWNNMIRRRARVGIFSRHEALSVYPEYRKLANTPGCRGSCSGSCKRTCTFDGRKWDTVAGVVGVRTAILESNILCDEWDPYRRGNNILAQEFIQSIYMNGLPSVKKSELNSAFQNAKRRRIWKNSYAMQNVVGYFSEASGVWFGINHNRSSGGMDSCGSEMSCRSRLRSKDPKLYAMLRNTFSPKDERAPGNLKICV